MNKNNFTFWLVSIVMMSLAMAGCPTDGNETKEPVNPYAGLTVAEQYWGDYSDDITIGIFRISKNEVERLSNDTINYPLRYSAYTDAEANLIVYGLSDGIYYSELYGYFPDNQTFTRVYEDGATRDYLRTTEN